MGDKPLYYGGGKSTPMYYGGSKKTPMYYGGSKGPAYYGGSGMSYGGVPYGGNLAYGGGGGGGEDSSFVGTITIGRMLRVIAQRWLSVFVFVLVGLVVSFAVYRISPTIYEAKSEFTMDMRRSSGGSRGPGGVIQDAMTDYGTSYSEIFNTRISDWRSDKVVNKIVQQYRANHPASTISDDEIIGAIAGSELRLQRNSRIITISVRSKDPKLAAAVANAYAEAIEAFTDEENKLRCDKAVTQIHSNAEKKRREVDKIAKQILDFRTANKVDTLRSTRDTVKQSMDKTTTDILNLESSEIELVEYEKLLSSVKDAPETFNTLSANVPRAQDIAKVFSEFQNAVFEYQGMLVTFTENHPEAVVKRKKAENAKVNFLEAAKRALQSCQTQLNIARNRLSSLRKRQEELRNELAGLAQRIVLAESGLGQLNAEFDVANRVLEGLILDENKARLEAEGNNEIVRVGRPAGIPRVPILPNPTVIFGAGIALSLVLGLLFVLVIDNLEDTVVSLSDIEGRLALKVLAVLPHVRRKKREQVAKFVVEEKYSHFSESVAGLRNLLDSPRYEMLSRCMLVISTQPGEGKTITSCSIAVSYAQAGRRTLLVDFDMRRPRQARIWGLELDKEHSFSHVLQNAGVAKRPDFSKLANKTMCEGLEVIASLPPDGVNPAMILGSSVVGDFFEWARSQYDRVIVDSPPYGLVGDVVSLAVLVDSAIIMCCPDRTHFKPIQYCSRCLTEAGANILGVIVNDVEMSNASAFSPGSHHGSGYRSGYGYGYGGYGYGYGYGPSDSKADKDEDGNTDSEAVPSTEQEFTDEE